MGDSDIFDSSRLVGSSQISHSFHPCTPLSTIHPSIDLPTYRYIGLGIARSDSGCSYLPHNAFISEEGAWVRHCHSISKC